MVKGVSRRVVVIKSPGGGVFEQAIFFVREDAARGGLTDSGIVAEARRIADESAKRARRSPITLAPLLWSALGALPVGLLWAICEFL